MPRLTAGTREVRVSAPARVGTRETLALVCVWEPAFRPWLLSRHALLLPVSQHASLSRISAAPPRRSCQLLLLEAVQCLREADALARHSQSSCIGAAGFRYGGAAGCARACSGAGWQGCEQGTGSPCASRGCRDCLCVSCASR